MVNEDIHYYANGKGSGLKANLDSAVNIMLNIFKKNNWEPYTQKIQATGETITIVPVFKENEQEKNEKTCIEYMCLDENNNELKKFRAKSLKRFMNQLSDYVDTVNNAPIEVVCTLTDSFGKGVKQDVNIQEVIKNSLANEPVKLVRIANNSRNYKRGADINQADETAIEVRTMDDKSLGWLPQGLPEKPRIARYLVSHKPYEASIYRRNGGWKMKDGSRKPYTVDIYIKFD